MKHMIKKCMVLLMILGIVFSSMAGIQPVKSAQPIRLMVNGQDITHLAAPFIENSRTMVPVRFIAEAIGATVTWDGENRTVSIKRGNQSVFLRIDSYLVEYNNGAFYQLSDVAPKIVNSRTYVPVRLISNAFGVGIDWENDTRTVTVDSSQTSVVESFYDIKITSHQNGDVIGSNTNVSVDVDQKYVSNNNEMRLLLLDPQTAKGFVVSQTNQVGNAMAYHPRPTDQGKKVLVAAIYDQNGNFVGGDVKKVILNVQPKVNITEVNEYEPVTSSLQIKNSTNFLTTHVKYEIQNLETGRTTTVDRQDPLGSFTWTPVMEQNGLCSITVTAYDPAGNAYSSSKRYVYAQVDKRLSLGGVSAGATISAPVTLSASRNFDVREITYLIRNVYTGEESILSSGSTGSYSWFPKPEHTGYKELYVRVTDADGRISESPSVRVNVDGSPRIRLQGVGPRQVVTSAVSLSSNSNVELDNITYIYENNDTKETRVLASGLKDNASYTYTPLKADAGSVTLTARGTYQGNTITSQRITFTVYTDTVYGPQAVIEQNKFLDFAAKMAVVSWKDTGMSAALQTAQAILETGWGQSVPVDKYSGQLSNNLFGIKGTGPRGSVISNTWEVYGGVSYRVDDYFRAYNNIQESWDDHKSLLLNAGRYQPFRDVMYSSMLGAWAIRRSGYATDPLYAIKLMDIIRRFNLEELDKTGI